MEIIYVLKHIYYITCCMFRPYYCGHLQALCKRAILGKLSNLSVEVVSRVSGVGV
jgi:hypothetical protein